MEIWHILGTLITAIALMELLPGKEVTMPDRASLGVVTDIKAALAQDKIWVVLKGQSRWSMIPLEQIVGLTDRVILLEDWLPQLG